MKGRLVAALAVWTLSGHVAHAAGALEPRALVDRYCVTCHSAARKTAGIVLEGLNPDQVGESTSTWEKVVRKLRIGAMPPAGMPRPDKPAIAGVVSELERRLDAAAALRPNPGRPTVHRLNRDEYANAVRDLLGLEVDVRALLPADSSGYGFDNIADVLSVTPGLLDRYLSAAARIGRIAIGDSTLRPTLATYAVSPMLRQDTRMGDDLPFGSRGGVAIRHLFPLDGEYVISVRLGREITGAVRGLAEPHQLEVRLDRTRVAVFTLGGEKPGIDRNEYELTGADAHLDVHVAVKAGERLVGVSFVATADMPEGVLPPPVALNSLEYASLRATPPLVDAVRVGGPYGATTPTDSISRRRIFICDPRASGEEACARRILTSLARRAYRRPPSPAQLDRLYGLYENGRRRGTFDDGIEWAVEGLLTSPDFLLRVERDPADVAAGAAYQLADDDMASRLSFFLWSSIPDDELLDLAERGRLRDARVLAQQVRRMMSDSRSRALVRNFGGQWLYLRNMKAIAPDPLTFPEFDDNLRQALQQETELFLESQLRDDRPILDLLRADYTFLNERLANHYRIPGVYGSHFRRVTMSGAARRGLLGQGSILMVTSYPTRTSPVVRGKWLLENLLGITPPPPPPNVPPFPESDGRSQPKSVRERMEQHRTSPACASCHAQMDPLGFALENFDATGRWRESDGGSPVDASGALPDGTVFRGPEDFRNILLGRGDELVTTVAEKLLTYALGRGLEPYDMPAIRAILRSAGGRDATWSSIVQGIVTSLPFQMRTARSQADFAKQMQP